MTMSNQGDLNRAHPLKGVQFVTDSHGQKVAVVLDLKEWGEVWEDIYGPRRVFLERGLEVR